MSDPSKTTLDVTCPECLETTELQDFLTETNQCYHCHDAGDPMDCRCGRCVDRAVAKADFWEPDYE